MDRRGYPFDNNGNRQHSMNVQMAQQALEMEEAIYLQRQQALDRELQLQQLIMQEQLQQEALSNAVGLQGSLHGARGLYGGVLGGGLGVSGAPGPVFGGGAGAASLAAQYEQELLRHQQQQQQQAVQQQKMQEQEMVRQQIRMQQQLNSQQQAQQPSVAENVTEAEKLVKDSLAANAIRRSSLQGVQRKRSFDQTDASTAGENSTPATKRAAPTRPSAMRQTSSSSVTKSKPKGKKKTSPDTTPSSPEKSKKIAAASQKDIDDAEILLGKNSTSVDKESPLEDSANEETFAAMEESLPASMLGLRTSVLPSKSPSPPPFTPIVKGTVESLLAVAEGEEKVDIVTKTIVDLKKTVHWNDLLEDDDREYEEGEIIDLPNFKSVLPRLPSEPLYENDNWDVRDNGDKEETLETNGKISSSKSPHGDKKSKSGAALSMTVEYPYPVDSWWPSINSIRRERRTRGEPSEDEEEEEDIEEPSLSSETDCQFRADLEMVRQRLATESEPGMLEKVPHCRIHRMAMKSQKVASAPDHAFCWQVTENYCNHPMVCCSICSTWRHAACGGHYKPYTVKESTEEAFLPVCDRCHIEESIVEDFPNAKARLERQRVEQLRRGLSTSHVIRKASFAKHGGTYKWPLGSVSATHIGGHTRSVHSRHDKAEKQWSEMVTRLSRTSGYRPKERGKVRTRELERLLVSIEDSEGATDRHNMMLFLMHDTQCDKPVGYEKRRRNIFDPEDDEVLSDEYLNDSGSSSGPQLTTTTTNGGGDGVFVGRQIRKGPRCTAALSKTGLCSRKGCDKKCRFDSIFCSDACGVSALEMDLLYSFQYSTDIHPSLLRS